MIIGDFNIHMKNDSDPLTTFTAILDRGECQNVAGPTHACNNTVDVILSHDVLVEHVSIYYPPECSTFRSLLVNV